MLQVYIKPCSMFWWRLSLCKPYRKYKYSQSSSLDHVPQSSKSDDVSPILQKIYSGDVCSPVKKCVQAWGRGCELYYTQVAECLGNKLK